MGLEQFGTYDHVKALVGGTCRLDATKKCVGCGRCLEILGLPKKK